MLLIKGNRWVGISAVVSMMLTACSGNTPESNTHSSPALKINGQVINDMELQIKAGMQTGNGEAKLQPVSAQILENVVGSELMHQAALDAKLDKDPIISARIADSTRRILALAYVDRLIRDIKPPTNEEIDAYYNSYPDLYAERMQFELRECLIQPTQAEQETISAKLKDNIQFEAFEKWLTDGKIAHQTSPIALLGDQLPEDLADKVKPIQVGGHILLNGKNTAEMRVVFVLARNKSPLSLTQAKTSIIKTINDQRRKDTLGEVKKSLRDKAKVEYIPPYTANGFSPEIKSD